MDTKHLMTKRLVAYIERESLKRTFVSAVLLGLFWRRWCWPALLGAVLVSLSRVYLGRENRYKNRYNCPSASKTP